MLNDKNGMLFSPSQAWRVERKMKAHALNQKYNTLTEYQLEGKKSSFARTAWRTKRGCFDKWSD